MNTMELLTVALLAAWSAPRCAGAECACDEGWTGAGERAMCYAAFDGPLVPDGAAAACLDAGGTLASIADQAEYDAVRELHDQRAAAMHIGLRLADGQWANPDGADTGYVTASWSPGEPRGAGKHHCAAITGQDWRVHKLVVGLLNDIPCDQYDSAFACSKAAECAAVCPDGWTSVSGGTRHMCYKAFGEAVSRADANAACDNAGGASLATVADEAELDAVLRLAVALPVPAHNAANPTHIGLEKVAGDGLRDNADGEWANIDGEDASYLATKWNTATAEPRGDGPCAYLNAHDGGQMVAGTLDDGGCTASYPYVCGKPAA